jgi:hypothetical protein
MSVPQAVASARGHVNRLNAAAVPVSTRQHWAPCTGPTTPIMANGTDMYCTNHPCTCNWYCEISWSLAGWYTFRATVREESLCIGNTAVSEMHYCTHSRIHRAVQACRLLSAGPSDALHHQSAKGTAVPLMQGDLPLTACVGTNEKSEMLLQRSTNTTAGRPWHLLGITYLQTALYTAEAYPACQD